MASVLCLYLMVPWVGLWPVIVTFPGHMVKICYTFLFLFSDKILVFRAVRIANREDPDQTASSEAVRSGSVLFVEAL